MTAEISGLRLVGCLRRGFRFTGRLRSGFGFFVNKLEDDDFRRGEQPDIHPGRAGAVGNIQQNITDLTLSAIVALSIAGLVERSEKRQQDLTAMTVSREHQIRLVLRNLQHGIRGVADRDRKGIR